MPMNVFMDRFGGSLFEGATARLNPEYRGGREELDAVFQSSDVQRKPFPAQAEVVKAAHVHLQERNAKMVFVEAEMGAGKTTIASLIAAEGVAHDTRPFRTVVVCPPHLVGKWAREVETILPNARVMRINSAGTNRILRKAAEANPGRPDTPEFWIIGRVRLRMDYNFVPALVRRPDGMGGHDFHCPNCGHRPVVQKKLKSGEGMPDYAVSVRNSEDECETGDGYWLNVRPQDVSRGQQCENVARPDGSLQQGCNTPLWQAVRNANPDPITALERAFRQLPGVGHKLAERLALKPDAVDIAQALEDGDIPQGLAQHLGTARLRRIQSWLEHNTFSLRACDFAPVRYMHKHMPHAWFEYAIFDEVHELKGDTSAQGTAYGILAGLVNKVICLTGTLVDGYARSLHPLLFRADPQRMIDAGYGANDSARFQWEMGVVREITTTTSDVDHTSSRARRKTKATQNLPGLHPAAVVNLLLPNTIFLSLADVEASIQALQPAGEKPARLLPSYREVFVAHAMDTVQKTAVEDLTHTLGEALRSHQYYGRRNPLLAPVTSALLRYPDDCYRETTVTSKREGQLAHANAVITPDGLLPKERFLIELARRESSQGRRMVLFTIYTGERDISKRYLHILTDAGIKAVIMRSSVPTEERELWMAERTEEGAEVVICNPELVKTGLDLYAYPTLYFAQTGYRVDTILQASRRSWRIGQTQPVRVYFGGYADSPQIRALRLVAKKVRVANQAKGNIAAGGLTCLDDDDEASAMQALANTLLEERRDRSHDTLIGSIASLEEDVTDEEYGADSIQRMQAIVRNAYGQPGQPATASICPSQEGAANSHSGGHSGDHSGRVVVMADYVERIGRKTVHRVKEIASDEVPVGTQLAMF
ncbi:MAG: hypothetical protein L0H29_00350 [Sinobacteraceae bacterium]|nr:hypothetical protein [Nevskiaceae bacterium]